ncbi:carbohydrate ABC transporter membrane protein 1 (CUT1 family) [Promicromonospora sp. AC04]|uniref:ABC transporter permease n=1 Tax=Promicromonospora sp. AC04 TaxID=2135723 RepID=UPI000D4B7112|nr:ABC transporter permease subunit [Promicromonospora sp. AC04]PUB27614.1 carbohydrate ABC transporter membrane protein 1 (CUT1 family) [Promicromonospora sp. AC04]
MAVPLGGARNFAPPEGENVDVHEMEQELSVQAASRQSQQAGQPFSRESTDRPRPTKTLVRHLAGYWQHWLMVLPAMLFVLLFAYVPMYGLRLAVFEYDPAEGLLGGDFVGLKYIQMFVTSPLFGQVLTNTLRISLGTLVLGFLAPIILALLFNQIAGGNTKRIAQTITYMPHFISVVVIVAMINIFLNPNTGLLGAALGSNVMAEPELFAPVYWLSEVWQHAGWSAIIYLAALSNVDTNLYEAAKLDGAGRIRLIRHIDIPAILPICGILLILNLGQVLSVSFEKALLMQNALNLSASEVISTYVYRVGILGNQFSYATAIGLFNSVINLTLLVIANTIAKRVSNTSLY